MRIKVTLISSAFLASAAAFGAHAQNMEFTSTVDEVACTIILINHGTLATQAGGTQLSSKASGAIPGVIHVINRGFARITAIPPQTPQWDIAPAGIAYTNFVATIAGQSIANDGTNFPEVSGYAGANLGGPYTWPTGWRSGTTEVTVHLTGTLTTGAFPDGNYKATVTTICE